MNDPLEIPEHIRKAAATVEIFFKVNGINEWALMGIQSRRSEPEPAPDLELACHHQAIEILRLTSLVATGRAAREQVEKQIAMDTECIERIRTAGETAEARLVEAMEILKKVSESCAGDRYARHGFGQLPRFVGCSMYQKHAEDEWCCACEAMAFRISTTPPPLLVELAELKTANDTLHSLMVSAEKRGVEKGRAEHAALKLKLEVAKWIMLRARKLLNNCNCAGSDGWKKICKLDQEIHKALSQFNESK